MSVTRMCLRTKTDQRVLAPPRLVRDQDISIVPRCMIRFCADRQKERATEAVSDDGEGPGYMREERNK